MKTVCISKCSLTDHMPSFTIAARCVVTDDERAARIEALLVRRSQATARKTALISETREFEARLGEFRAAFGNPYFYSGMDGEQSGHAGESVAQYTGDKAHEPGRRIALAFIETNRELRAVSEELRAMGVSVE